MAKTIYFSKAVENAIVEYNETQNFVIKSKIYREQIDKPLKKLVENIINRFKFPYFKLASEDLHAEVVSFLVLNMSKYDQEKGKAFSYFSILAKNHLIMNNTDEYKELKRQRRIDVSDGEHSFDIIDENQDRHFNDDTPEFIEKMIEYWEHNLCYIFTKKQELMIADSIMTLFKRIHLIENFNKKSLYVLIREMTGLRTQYITTVINKMKKHIDHLQTSYNNTGYFNMSSTT